MNDHNPVTPLDDALEGSTANPAPVQSPQTPPLDEATITAQVEQRLRRQLAELTEIAAQAKRLGVTVDPAQALARGVAPDALRQSVLKQAAERGVAQDIVAEAPLQPQTKPQSVADSPLVNPFDVGGFTLAEMSAAIQMLPNPYGQVGQLGLFAPEPISQRNVTIESVIVTNLS